MSVFCVFAILMGLWPEIASAALYYRRDAWAYAAIFVRGVYYNSESGHAHRLNYLQVAIIAIPVCGNVRCSGICKASKQGC